MAFQLAQGYYAHSAAIEVAKGPHAEALASETPLGQIASYVARKDGTLHTFDLPYYLGQAQTNPDIAGELPRVWLVGSLLTLGDALGKYDYFDHAPVLELVYHLRNGIAHGNRFNFKARGNGLKRLQRHPAHNRAAGVRSATGAEFEIKPSLQSCPVLFEYMGPGDVLDLLQSVEVYLTRIRERNAMGQLDGLSVAAQRERLT